YPPVAPNAPSTRSPTDHPVTSSPTPITTPATSPPGMYGGGAEYWYLPSSINVSGKVTAEADTSTSSCRGPATGSSTDSTTRSSGGPNALHMTAFMLQL